MQKIWKMQSNDVSRQHDLGRRLNVDPIVAQLLINRGIVDEDVAKVFLSASLEELYDPFIMAGMKEAVARIHQAQRDQERVLVFGDYDVDGVTSSAILFNTLTRIGIDVVNHIPHRMDDGYGLNLDIIDALKEKQIRLLITIDCGITAHQETAALRAAGFDVIIIDHHEPPEGDLPDANAVINPKQAACPYPYRELAAVGLAFKLSQALLGEVDEEMLDLAALGTVADIVPLTGENRVIVKNGLQRINKTKNVGLRALLDITKIKDKKITPFHIGFVLGPRINAAGRMDSAHTSLDLFLSKDTAEAYELARDLEKHNQARQKLQRSIVDEAIELVEHRGVVEQEKVIIVSKPGWHKGVLGIVASKVSERYCRPTIVISVEDEIGTASARSVDGFHLYNALSHCSSCLEHFGGHEGAAGLTMDAKNIDPFREMINSYATKVMQLSRFVPVIQVDCEIELNAISLELANIISDLQPYGEGNPEPIFCSRHLSVVGVPRILGRETLKFWVSDGEISLSAVGFGMAKFKPMVQARKPLDLVYQIGIDDWNKAPVPQLILKDVKYSGE